MLSPERIVNELSSYFGNLAVAVKVHVFECRGGHLLFWGWVLPYNVKYNGILEVFLNFLRRDFQIPCACF